MRKKIKTEIPRMRKNDSRKRKREKWRKGAKLMGREGEGEKEYTS